MRRLLTLLPLAALLTAILTVFGPAPASAGVTIQVQSFRDANQAAMDGKCSLRAAISASNGNSSNLYCFHDGSVGRDTIVLKAGTYRLEVSGNDDNNQLGDLDVSGNLLIKGAGADRTTIDASDLSPGDRLFDILGGPVTLKNLMLTGGDSNGSNGGAIWNVSSLILDRVIVHDNIGLNGGGLFHGSGATDLDVRNSTFSSNDAQSHGGGIYINGPGASLTNVTVSGNRADVNGGGMGISATNGTELHSVTISNNVSDRDDEGSGKGGGLYASASSNNVLENSFLARNRDKGLGVKAPDCRFESSTLSSNHDNFIANPQNCELPAGTNNILDEKGRIGNLGSNGGPTRTHAFSAGSPAFGDGSGCPATDQRGVPRNGRCDIGAYERVMCAGVLVNRVGTDAKDKLTGTTAADGFLTFGGNDVIKARGGKDGACPGGGNDRVRGQGNVDKVLAAAGNDRVFGGPGGDKLKGNAGDDLLDGDGGTDRCRGGPGANTIRQCET